MKFKDQSELYFQRMDSAVDQKAELLRWTTGPKVAELGPGSGSLTELIAVQRDIDFVLALDASAEAVAKLSERFEANPRVEFDTIVLGEHPRPFGDRRFDSIVASSVFHEVYSFLGLRALELIATQVREALVPGGRFILRDGVQPDDRHALARMTVSDRLLELAQRYCAEGRPDLRPTIEGNVVTGTRHQIAELAFTVTWGLDSFDREVEEQYQLYELQDAVSFYQGFGLELVHAETYTQDGYIDHLADSPLETRNASGNWEPWFPATNALWVFEKR